jgi:predicted DNA-binding transcriptional regulator AlpA
MTRTILKLRDVSEKTGVPIPTLRYWRYRGDIGPEMFRLGGSVVAFEDVVEAWIEEQAAASRAS